MKAADFLKAIEIISKSHSVDMVINHVESNGQVSPVLESPTIGIKECPAAVINNLKNAGYSLAMHNSMLLVNKY
jgi:hypothetical protein